MFGFFFYIGDDRVRHESLELRAVLGYLPLAVRNIVSTAGFRHLLIMFI